MSIPTSLDKIDPELLLKCYSIVTNSNKIHDKFIKIKFEEKKDRIKIYNAYTMMMLHKYMKEKGFEELSKWTCSLGGRLRTAGGNCNFNKRHIQIADWFIESEITKFEDIRETILHEIAHANAWLKHKESKHGPLWVKEAKLIGCTGNRCLPKKYSGILFESAVYKCMNLSDKCICIKTGSKQSLSMYSKKIPTLVCIKHRLKFDYIETRPYVPPGEHSFGNNYNDNIVLIDDGEVIEIGSNGDIISLEPDVCIKYD